MLGNLNFTSPECMLVDISYTKIVKAFGVALDLLTGRHIIVLTGAARIGSCNERTRRKIKPGTSDAIIGIKYKKHCYGDDVSSYDAQQQLTPQFQVEQHVDCVRVFCVHIRSRPPRDVKECVQQTL